ncbi:hypothetical protein ACFXKC_53870 [Streptomyces sp. NPDC059340]|uniref:hypothetical protein n=1 Tax=Streptomyces sp. NPDC059340 TaxID=3346806 RepID=UPI00369ADED3
MKTTVVRTTLEGLVATSHAHRTKRGSSVFSALLLEQGVELVVIKELLGHAHIGVTATVYAHIRLRLQRQAIDLLGRALVDRAETGAEPDDGDDPQPCAAPVR